ncbi:MAG: hypothetical protein NT015_10570 [Alphaproteobacteria bacterium]|nr:hypothetical protein [Alphaproteobacteria bacterium]
MTTPPPPENAKFDVAVEPAPRHEVVDAEEDEQAKREREAALASTFDQSLAHNGKTDEELIEERQDETRMILDAAIVVGIAIAVAEHEALDVEDVVLPEINDDDGGD